MDAETTFRSLHAVAPIHVSKIVTLTSARSVYAVQMATLLTFKSEIRMLSRMEHIPNLNVIAAGRYCLMFKSFQAFLAVPVASMMFAAVAFPLPDDFMADLSNESR